MSPSVASFIANYFSLLNFLRPSEIYLNALLRITTLSRDKVSLCKLLFMLSHPSICLADSLCSAISFNSIYRLLTYCASITSSDYEAFALHFRIPILLWQIILSSLMLIDCRIYRRILKVADWSHLMLIIWRSTFSKVFMPPRALAKLAIEDSDKWFSSSTSFRTYSCLCDLNPSARPIRSSLFNWQPDAMSSSLFRLLNSASLLNYTWCFKESCTRWSIVNVKQLSYLSDFSMPLRLSTDSGPSWVPDMSRFS